MVERRATSGSVLGRRYGGLLLVAATWSGSET